MELEEAWGSLSEHGRIIITAGVYYFVMQNNPQEHRPRPEGVTNGELKRIIKELRMKQYPDRELVDGIVSFIRREWLHKEVTP